MSLKTQAKVLRVLQDGEVEPVGAGKPFTVDVRVIAATNKDLRTEVGEDRFREDLYYRLAVVVIRTPALREHPEDISELVEHFTHEFCEAYNRRLKHWTDSALATLRHYRWPGNVRELRNVVERAVIMELDDEISTANLLEPPERTEALGSFLSAQTLHEFQQAAERAYIVHQLQRHSWNVAATARAIDTPRSNLYKKIQAYDIQRDGG